MTEIWKTMPEYPGYHVSDLGNVQSTKRVYVRSNGRPHTTPERRLKPSLDSKGYLQFHPYVGTKRLHVLVHKVVFEAFHRPLQPGEDVHHKDHDRTNNCAENLEALTRKEHYAENRQHAYDAAYRDGYTQALIDLQGA